MCSLTKALIDRMLTFFLENAYNLSKEKREREKKDVI